MKISKQHLLTSLLLLAGLAIPGAFAGVIQLTSGTDTALDWKSSSTQGGIDSSSVYLNDGIGYNGNSYAAQRGNECGIAFALQAPAGQHLGIVDINVLSFIAAWRPNAYAYGTYKAGSAATMAPGMGGTQYIWDIAGGTQWFYNNAKDYQRNTIHLDFTGLGYDYAYLGFFLNNNDTYDGGGFQLFTSAADGSSPGLVITSTIAAIPEPATVGLLALGGLALLRRRRS